VLELLQGSPCHRAEEVAIDFRGGQRESLLAKKILEAGHAIAIRPYGK
jgi:hypothetical protein